MSIVLFDENGHLTKNALEEFKKGNLQDIELIQISEHVSQCEKCSDEMADSFTDTELAEAPLGFEEEVNNRISDRKKANVQFVLYSIRVSIAACIALVFVFSNTLNVIANTKVKTVDIVSPNLSIVNSINKSLDDFSQKIISMEVFNSENKEK
ncbi:hypothetical protein [Clostridium tyrobutyricum]|uniref:hypothetical protein n=1 Tax=Clostridium tyrobutyricum TaxID=1519 RepID=UPI00057D7CB6|nr:hypothetical protein [Clostridium tyrobutyricum]MBV4424234.1 hypothetical protein [Clostridium tyrobutyricum]MBV4445875.1 hypothetical protein [Clostridium tyrobutyricum]